MQEICGDRPSACLFTAYNPFYDPRWVQTLLPPTCKLTVVEGEGKGRRAGERCGLYRGLDAATHRVIYHELDPRYAAQTLFAKDRSGRQADPSGRSNSQCLMHAKLHLLRHENFLRVVISSANQTKGDWDSVVQISWVCDFARAPAGGGRSRPSLFAAELSEFVGICLSEYAADRKEWCDAIESEFEVVVADGVHLIV